MRLLRPPRPHSRSHWSTRKPQPAIRWLGDCDTTTVDVDGGDEKKDDEGDIGSDTN